TRSSSAIICEVVRLEALGPWETTAGTSLSTACARVTSTAEPISLGRIIPVEYVWPKCLVRSARARWQAEMDSLAPIREGESQSKFNLRSTGEIHVRLDLEWRGICASLVNWHVRIS